jgi:hypothetical protein
MDEICFHFHNHPADLDRSHPDGAYEGKFERYIRPLFGGDA